jgi:hypothetical protein
VYGRLCYAGPRCGSRLRMLGAFRTFRRQNPIMRPDLGPFDLLSFFKTRLFGVFVALCVVSLLGVGCDSDGGSAEQPLPSGCGPHAPCAAGESCGVDKVCRAVDLSDVGEPLPDVTPVTCGATTCASGEGCCDGACVSLRTDSENCGVCGYTCPLTQTCVAGQCEAVNSICDGRRIACGFECIDPQTDPKNCGECWVVCGDGQQCSASRCVASTTCVQENFSRCGLDCVDLQADPDHCGTCFEVCAEDALCVAGDCQPVVCNAPATRCGRICVDLARSPDNCGRCGRACNADEYCSGSECLLIPSCAADEAFCLDTETCANTDTDNQNCGECGTVCAEPTTCQGGACLCPVGTRRCDGVCVDTLTSNEHCGVCDNACTNPQTCNAGTCE